MISSVAVAGTFAPNVGLVEVETAKVPAPPQYVMPSGEPLRKRWSVVAAGLASDGLVELPRGAEAGRAGRKRKRKRRGGDGGGGTS